MATLSARHIFDILYLLGAEARPVSATEVSQKLNIPLTTAHRGLNTLEHMRYVEHYQESKNYTIGPNIWALVHGFLGRFPLRDIAVPYMHRLVVLYGNTVSLYCRIGYYAARITSIKGSNEVIFTGPTGEVHMLSNTPAGILMLAFMEPRSREAFLEMRQKSGADIDVLKRRISEAQQDGWFVEKQGPLRGHCMIPVLDADGFAVGVVAIEAAGNGAEADMVTPNEMNRYIEQLAGLNERVKAYGDRYNSPFAHIDPATIVL